MKLSKPDRFPRRPHATEVLGTSPEDPNFSLEKYVTPEDWELVARLLEWIAKEHNEAVQPKVWGKLEIVARWIQVFDPARLSLITGDQRIQILAKKILGWTPVIDVQSLGRQLFPEFLKQGISANTPGSFEYAKNVIVGVIQDRGSMSYQSIDIFLVQTAQMYPEKLEEIRELMEQKEIWKVLFAQLKRVWAGGSHVDATRLAANIIILDPEKQPEVQKLIQPVQAKILEEDRRRIRQLIENRTMYHQRDEEATTKPHLQITANLAIINAKVISLDQHGRIRLGRKKRMVAGPTLPDRLVA